MRFLEIINDKKFTLISLFLFLYVMLNLLDGKRGLISYFENKSIKKQLIQKKKIIEDKLFFIEKKNILLTENIDLDYLETLYREKFMVGKSSEKVFKSNN